MERNSESRWVDLVQQIGTRFGDLENPGEGVFDDLARAAFTLQYDRIPAVGRLAQSRGIAPETLASWREIPPVPVLAFKSLELCVAPAAEIFRSSGTTGGPRSVHRHPFPDLYRKVIEATFPFWCLPSEDELGKRAPPMLALIPRRSQQPDSSLGFIVDHVLRRFGGKDSLHAFGSRGVEVEAATRWCEGRRLEGRPMLILATSFALAQWLEHLQAENRKIPLPEGSAIFDTGGFKGRVAEISRQELLGRLEEFLAIVPGRVVREYGMTELTSQFYTEVLRGGEDEVFVGPWWLRARLLDPETLDEVPAGEPGILSIFDLANVGSAVHILTQDLGVAESEGFRLLGRASEAELRGCSLTVEELRQNAVL